MFLSDLLLGLEVNRTIPQSWVCLLVQQFEISHSQSTALLCGKEKVCVCSCVEPDQFVL